MTTRAKGVVAFLILTFAATWSWLFAAVLLLELSLENPLVQLGGAFTPALAAIVVRRWITGEGFEDAGLALRLRGNGWHYLAAWLGPWMLVAAVLGLATALGAWRPDFTPLNEGAPGLPAWALLLALLAATPLLAPLYWGEEFGWRSYLRLRIFPDHPLLSSLVTGLIWAVWHYPLAYLGYVHFDSIIIGLAIWTFSFIFQEIILSWLRLRSGTVWTASLAHAGNNMVLFLIVGTLLEDGGLSGNATTLLITAPMVVISVWIVATGRHKAPAPA